MFNNNCEVDLLRLPAIVLLNTTFQPGNSKAWTYTRRRPELPGRNVVFNKTIAGSSATKNSAVECEAGENVWENVNVAASSRLTPASKYLVIEGGVVSVPPKKTQHPLVIDFLRDGVMYVSEQSQG